MKNADDVVVELFRVQPYDLPGAIDRYEGGEMTSEEEVELFQVLVSTNLIRDLQGSYQRRAIDLIHAGLVQVN
jgi:hypothetical protein